MLEVHPPHESTHSWKGFFIHLGTITIGLLLAISLEQFVVHLHERAEVRETRVALQAEHQENVARFHRNVRAHLRALALLHNNLRVFTYLRAHPATPEPQLPGSVLWPIFAEPPLKAAWSTAQSTNVLALMTPDEVRGMAADYFQLDYAWQLYQPVLATLALCVSYHTYTSDVSTLKPDALEQVIDCTRKGQSLQTVYGDQLSIIGIAKDYAPIPDWWHMVPFFQMSDSFEHARLNRDAYRQTMQDIATALAADPDPMGYASSTNDVDVLNSNRSSRAR